MTIILILVGIVVGFVSIFTSGFRSAGKRLAAFAIAGLVVDVLITVGFTATMMM